LACWRSSRGGGWRRARTSAAVHLRSIQHSPKLTVCMAICRLSVLCMSPSRFSRSQSASAPMVAAAVLDGRESKGSLLFCSVSRGQWTLTIWCVIVFLVVVVCGFLLVGSERARARDDLLYLANRSSPPPSASSALALSLPATAHTQTHNRNAHAPPPHKPREDPPSSVPIRQRQRRRNDACFERAAVAFAETPSSSFSS
jgi:hypothetical protein